MKKLNTFLLFATLLALFLACNSEDEEPNPEFDNASFSAVIDEGGVPEEVQKEEAVLDSSVTEQTMPDGSTWLCTSKKYSVVDGNSDFPLFNPNASVIYPGSLLQGKSLVNATPSVIPVKRAGGTVSIDVIDGNLQPSFTVDEVTKSKIAEASNNIISGAVGVVPANFNFTAEQVQSSEQLAISLGLNFENQFAQVSSNFSFRQDKEYSRFIVKLNQSFFTLSFDIPSSVKDIFAPSVTPEDLSQYIGSGNPATFISDVTYGRVYYMLIESSASSMEIEAAVNASFTTATAGGGIDVETGYLSSLSDLQIKVVALGGESKSTITTIGETEISTLVDMLGESTDIRTGVPISYVVRSLKSKEIVNVKLATEYDVTECVPLATPLGSPIAWWDAVSITGSDVIPPCIDCLETTGKYSYHAGSDALRFDQLGLKTGAVVKKWPDISGNDFHASSIAAEPLSRPQLINNAFDNGLPAVEFFRLSNIDYMDQRLSYSGSVFINTEYTIFMVVAYKDKVRVQQTNSFIDLLLTVLDQPNQYGNFMTGSSETPLNNLSVGFLDNETFQFGHGDHQLEVNDPTFMPSSSFKVLAIRFSKTEGMAVYENGVLIAEDPTKTEPLQSNPGAIIRAPLQEYSRIRIGEIRAYGMAATEEQIEEETFKLNHKYGL